MRFLSLLLVLGIVGSTTVIAYAAYYNSSPLMIAWLAITVATWTVLLWPQKPES